MTTTPTKDELEAEIKLTRAELGDTVAALTHKLDVTSRVKQRVRTIPPAVQIGAVVTAVLAVALIVWRRSS